MALPLHTGEQDVERGLRHPSADAPSLSVPKGSEYGGEDRAEV